MLTPCDLALAFDRCLTAMVQGDNEAAMGFISWLEWFRSPELPPEPDRPPDAASFPIHQWVGLRWYQRDGAIFGYDGRPGACYRIPVDAQLPPSLPYPPYGKEEARPA